MNGGVYTEANYTKVWSKAERCFQALNWNIPIQFEEMKDLLSELCKEDTQLL